jgi:hypothetical protein
VIGINVIAYFGLEADTFLSKMVEKGQTVIYSIIVA